MQITNIHTHKWTHIQIVKEFGSSSHVADAEASDQLLLPPAVKDAGRQGRWLNRHTHWHTSRWHSLFYLIKNAHFYIFAKFLISIISAVGSVLAGAGDCSRGSNDSDNDNDNFCQMTFFEYVDTHTHSHTDAHGWKQARRTVFVAYLTGAQCHIHSVSSCKVRYLRVCLCVCVWVYWCEGVPVCMNIGECVVQHCEVRLSLLLPLLWLLLLLLVLLLLLLSSVVLALILLSGLMQVM